MFCQSLDIGGFGSVRHPGKIDDGHTLVHIQPIPHRLIVNVTAPIRPRVFFAADVQFIQFRRRQSVGAQPPLFVRSQRAGAGKQMVRPDFAAGVRRLVVRSGVLELLCYAFPRFTCGLKEFSFPADSRSLPLVDDHHVAFRRGIFDYPF
ncbi:hypothetical protein [Pyramidobacter piscolens]|uniref:hypothetical protein n=1 Tax=Pyramidobacter piscolens TaxID=638849 RepID=UPI003AB3AF16